MPAPLKNRTLEHVVRRTNKAGVAEFFGVHVSSVEGWVRQGCPVVQRGRRGVSWEFDLLDLARWHFRTDDVEMDLIRADVDPETLEPSVRLLWYKGEREKIGLEEKEGKLVSVDEYREELTFVLFQLVNAIQDIPDILEQEGIITAQHMDRAAETLDIVREEMIAMISDDVPRGTSVVDPGPSEP